MSDNNDKPDYFQHRWGVKEWDVGATTIPNPILEYYSRVPWVDKDGRRGRGISNQEMMCITHLASFHYESEQGESRPSIGTICFRMGYKKDDSVRGLIKSLEHKNFLVVERRSGKCSIYDFSNFSKAILKMEGKRPPHPNGDHSSGDLSDGGHPNGDHSSGDEEEKTIKEKKQEKKEEKIEEEPVLVFPENPEPAPSKLTTFQPGDDYLDVISKCAAKREQAGGNYAVPARAGGGDAFCDGPVDAFCEVLAGIAPALLPPKKRKQWAQKLRQIAEEWSTEGAVITAQVVERAIRAVPNDCDIGWKTYKSPFAGKFDEEIGPLLLNGGNPRQKGAPHGSHQRDNRSIAPGAVPRRVASEEEARAILGDKYHGK